jgi:hypothetical protein
MVGQEAQVVVVETQLLLLVEIDQPVVITLTVDTVQGAMVVQVDLVQAVAAVRVKTKLQHLGAVQATQEER